MTDNCEVRIVIRPPAHHGDKGYIGAGSSYDPLPGETHRRGNDLADGPANMATLCRIMNDIAALLDGYRNAYERDNTPVASDLPVQAAQQPQPSRSH